MIAWVAAELRSARTIAGGFGEAERSEGVAGWVVGAECRANPSRVPITILYRTGRNLAVSQSMASLTSSVT
jgi:hypothetical protein